MGRDVELKIRMLKLPSDYTMPVQVKLVTTGNCVFRNELLLGFGLVMCRMAVLRFLFTTHQPAA